MGRTIFNDPRIKLNILSGEINCFRPVYPISDEVTEDDDVIVRGRWVVLNEEGKLEAVTGDTGAVGCFLCGQSHGNGDVRAISMATDGSVCGGHTMVYFGVFMAEVGEIGYDVELGQEAYAPGTPLRVSSTGILVPADPATDVVTAYSLGFDVYQRNMLTFTTHGGR